MTKLYSEQQAEPTAAPTSESESIGFEPPVTYPIGPQTAPIQRAMEQNPWQRIGSGANYNNCTEYAFANYPTLHFEPDLATLLTEAERLGFVQTNAMQYASVILYGQGSQYSHAIRKVGGYWQEVYGNDMNRYTGDDFPIYHSGDHIVAALVEPLVSKIVPNQYNVTEHLKSSS